MSDTGWKYAMINTKVNVVINLLISVVIKNILMLILMWEWISIKVFLRSEKLCKWIPFKIKKKKQFFTEILGLKVDKIKLPAWK